MRANLLEDDVCHILDHTRDLWNDLRSGSIFISGGTGFFGRWLLESFVRANTEFGLNASATVLTRNPDAFIRDVPHLALNPAVSLLRGDVRSFDFPAGHFQFVIHAAGDAAPRNQTPDETFDVIVQGTRRMLDFACTSGASSFLFTSSGAVYGGQPSDITHVQEEFEAPIQPDDRQSPYSRGKRVAESLCMDYATRYPLSCKIARCFAFVGPYFPLDGPFAIGNFIRDALAGKPIRVTGDGTAYRSYLYSADLAIWLWTILSRGADCRPYNVGSEAQLTIGDLAERLSRLIGNGAGVEISKMPRPEVPPERYVPSTQRAQIELGLREWIDLDRAILSTAGSFQG